MDNKFTNKKTVDQAWSMMSVTLDKEMPVQKKRRAIWWIPVGLGLLVLASWVYVMSSEKTNVEPQQQIQNTIESRPIASKELEPSSTILHSTEIANQGETKLIENKKYENKSTSNLRPNNKNKAITKTDAPLKSTVRDPISTRQISMHSNPMKKKAPVAISDEKDAARLIADQSLVRSSSNAPAPETTGIKISTEKGRAKVNPASNPLAPLPILNNLQLDWEVEPNVEVLAPKYGKWDLGLKTAFLSDVKFDSPTLLVEAQIIRKIGLRWSLISGLGFKSQKFIFASFKESNLVSSSPINADAAFADSEDLNRNISFNFLYIPIGVKYSFKGRWSIAAGAHYNFLDLSNTYSNSLSNADQDELSFIQRFSRRNASHFSYFLSTNYRLGKRTSLLVQYQGNTERHFNEFRKVDAHQFGLGVNWQF